MASNADVFFLDEHARDLQNEQAADDFELELHAASWPPLPRIVSLTMGLDTIMGEVKAGVGICQQACATVGLEIPGDVSLTKLQREQSSALMNKLQALPASQRTPQKMNSTLKAGIRNGEFSALAELAGTLGTCPGAETGGTARTRRRVRRLSAAAQASPLQHEPTDEEVRKADEAAAALIKDEQAAKVKQSRRSAKAKKNRQRQQLQHPGQDPASSPTLANSAKAAKSTSSPSSGLSGDDSP